MTYSQFLSYLLAFCMVVTLGLLYPEALDHASLNLTALDNLATLGWSLLPFGLVWLLLRVAALLLVLRESVALVAAAKAEQLKAQAGKDEAIMWDVRHTTKRNNAWSKKA
ncbi:hypothetical protein [Pseudomonas phage Bertil]|uniref:Uncharacterized protein n=1 Tax=Pseudomonas phage Bertil TaxID=2801385 RepID=A0A7T8IWB4_9CAUD|nr:hypothetical protein [Pseudomonas phage Bertil]QQO90871.1 hypothetical protein [Pseudomonas phage Strit]